MATETKPLAEVKHYLLYDRDGSFCGSVTADAVSTTYCPDPHSTVTLTSFSREGFPVACFFNTSVPRWEEYRG